MTVRLTQLDSALFQGTGFPLTERERLGIRGLLPPRNLNMDRQVCSLYQTTVCDTHTSTSMSLSIYCSAA